MESKLPRTAKKASQTESKERQTVNETLGMTGIRTQTSLLATATGPTSEENGKSKKSPDTLSFF